MTSDCTKIPFQGSFRTVNDLNLKPSRIDFFRGGLTIGEINSLDLAARQNERDEISLKTSFMEFRSEYYTGLLRYGKAGKETSRI